MFYAVIRSLKLRRISVPAIGHISTDQDPSHIIATLIPPAPGAAWSYAIQVDRQQPETSARLVRLPVPQEARPWECPPLTLEVPTRRILNWSQEGDTAHPMTPGMPYLPLELTQAEEMVRLVLFGFTHLRLAYVPVIEREAGILLDVSYPHDPTLIPWLRNSSM